MKHFYTFLFACIVFASTAYADYTTPNTSVKWSLNDLVTNSSGSVTYNSGTYLVSGIVTISTTDTLSIVTDEVVKFDSGAYFMVNGSLKIDPPTSVLFTANNQTKGFNGIKFSFSPASVIRKLTLEYAISCNITDCSPTFDSCIFQYNNNNTSTSFGNGAIALFRSKAIFTNTQFLNNKRAAIQGGGNIANAPQVINCLFMGNNTTNQNVPQINLGASGADTTKIFGNQFLAASTNSGAMGFLPIGTQVNVLITGNIIKNNRYGINLQGGSLINSVVSYNIIDSNNTQNNPALGGSGIAFSGGSASSHQNSIVTGNMFRANLWGITIQNGAKPNLGNLANADTTDDGKNWFYGNSNTNTSTPGIHLYNNSPDPITAQGNYWGSNDPATIEARIYHQPDLNTLGLVDYTNYVLPVRLLSFNAAATAEQTVKLNWVTVNEVNNKQFIIERSADGVQFDAIDAVAGKNLATENYYSALDKTPLQGMNYYRLKQVDVDGKFTYSNIVAIKMGGAVKGAVVIYPNPVKDVVQLSLNTVGAADGTILIVDGLGKVQQSTAAHFIEGAQLKSLDVKRLNSGTYYLVINIGNEKLVKQFIKL